MKAEDPLKMHYAAKFYPEIINEELTTPFLRRLLWLQIRDGIVKDEIYCPAELCVLFAAQSVRRAPIATQTHVEQMQALLRTAAFKQFTRDVGKAMDKSVSARRKGRVPVKQPPA